LDEKGSAVSDRIDVRVGQQRLALAWLLGGVVVFLLALMRSSSSPPAVQPEDAWGWALPGILPTLSLIVSTVVLESKGQDQVTVDRFAYRISLALSAFYLLSMAGILVIPVFLRLNDQAAMLRSSKLWLGPLQGLVGIALGAFFVSREK
jgi:hypothetical protein